MSRRGLSLHNDVIMQYTLNLPAHCPRRCEGGEVLEDRSIVTLDRLGR